MRRVIGAVFAAVVPGLVLAALLAAFLGAGYSLAEGLVLKGGSVSRASMFRSQTKLLDTRLSRQYSASVRLTPNGGKGTGETAVPAFRGTYRGEYLAIAREAARKHGIPENLFLRLDEQESGWNPSAESLAGAKGLAQLMPDTARNLGVDIHDPGENLNGGARYLRMMYDRFGSWRLALAAYNAGPAAVEQNAGIPPFAETITYVKAIMGG